MFWLMYMPAPVLRLCQLRWNLGSGRFKTAFVTIYINYSICIECIQYLYACPCTVMYGSYRLLLPSTQKSQGVPTLPTTQEDLDSSILVQDGEGEPWDAVQELFSYIYRELTGRGEGSFSITSHHHYCQSFPSLPSWATSDSSLLFRCPTLLFLSLPSCKCGDDRLINLTAVSIGRISAGSSQPPTGAPHE